MIHLDASKWCLCFFQGVFDIGRHSQSHPSTSFAFEQISQFKDPVSLFIWDFLFRAFKGRPHLNQVQVGCTVHLVISWYCDRLGYSELHRLRFETSHKQFGIGGFFDVLCGSSGAGGCGK